MQSIYYYNIKYRGYSFIPTANWRCTGEHRLSMVAKIEESIGLKNVVLRLSPLAEA
jgi:hypothetical protein